MIGNVVEGSDDTTLPQMVLCNVSVQSSVFTYNTGRNRKLTQISSNDTRFTSLNLYTTTTTTTTTTIIFYTNTFKNSVTNEINVTTTYFNRETSGTQ